jgi:hypothetical protein
VLWWRLIVLLYGRFPPESSGGTRCVTKQSELHLPVYHKICARYEKTPVTTVVAKSFFKETVARGFRPSAFFINQPHRNDDPAKTTRIFLTKYFLRKLRNCEKIQKLYAKFQRGHWPRWNRFGGVNEPADIVSARSMTPLKLFQQGQWPCQNGFSEVNDPAEIRIL